jgi:hypothetical protein
MKKNLRGRKRMFTQKLDMTDDLESETPSQEFQLEQREIQTKFTLEKIERTDIEEFDRFTQKLDMAPFDDSDSENIQMLSDPSQLDKSGQQDIEEFDRFTQQLDMAPLEDSDSEIMQMLSDPSQQDLEGLERQDAEDH